MVPAPSDGTRVIHFPDRRHLKRLLAPGSVVGRYELVRELGSGGAGTVFEAVFHGPAGFAKSVALKVVDHEHEALIREARLGAQLHHPNLVDVYALEEADGVWHLAMELVTGGSLRDLRPLPPRAAVEAVIQACAGLAYAHDAIGLVHMDIKPANLLLQGANVKVADLGIAHARGFLHDGQLRGTPSYVAPETLARRPVDGRADVWAIGVVLIELITGRASLDPAMVPSLRPVLERCLTPDPAGRMASVADVGAALEALSLPGPGLVEVVDARRR